MRLGTTRRVKVRLIRDAMAQVRAAYLDFIVQVRTSLGHKPTARETRDTADQLPATLAVKPNRNELFGDQRWVPDDDVEACQQLAAGPVGQ